MQIMTARTTTIRTLYVHIVLNGMIFPQISYDIVPYARHFLPVKYFTKYYFIKLCIQLPQNVTSLRADENDDQHKYWHHWGKFGSLNLLSERGDLSLLLAENIQGKFQKIQRQLLFLRNHHNFDRPQAVLDLVEPA